MKAIRLAGFTGLDRRAPVEGASSVVVPDTSGLTGSREDLPSLDQIIQFEGEFFVTIQFNFVANIEFEKPVAEILFLLSQ